MKSRLILLNYGCGNMASIRNAIKTLGIDFEERHEGLPDDISDCIFLLPGVGSFAEASKALKERGFLSLRGIQPKLIGICLGMQLLFEDSDEGGFNQGLGLIPGNVRSIRDESCTPCLRVPHIGWERQNLLLEQTAQKIGISFEFDVYFVHSFHAINVPSENLVSTVEYEDIQIPATVVNKNVIGFQFHPEKSGQRGLDIIKNSILYLDRV